jgi:hypothetical protein
MLTYADGSLLRHVSDICQSVLARQENEKEGENEKEEEKDKEFKKDLTGVYRVTPADIAALAQAYTHAQIWDEKLFRALSGAVRRYAYVSIRQHSYADICFRAVPRALGAVRRYAVTYADVC